MAEFFRPEARAALWRWRETLAGMAIAGFGVWWGVGAANLVQWLGWAFVALGAAVAVAGVQRGRFRTGRGGPGVVQVVERRLAYFGPLTGGVIDMEDLVRLEFEPHAHPAAHWVLTATTGQSVAVPANAKGADALFDLFASLPGLRTPQVLAMLEQAPARRTTLWERPPDRLN